MFSFICAWINGWLNNRDAGDLRRHRAHYYVTVMFQSWDVIGQDVDPFMLYRLLMTWRRQEGWRLPTSCIDMLADCDILLHFNTLRLEQNGCHFAGDSLNYVFVNENCFFLLMTNEIFVRGPINNKPAFVQITDMHRTVYKALSESMTV